VQLAIHRERSVAKQLDWQRRRGDFTALVWIAEKKLTWRHLLPATVVGWLSAAGLGRESGCRDVGVSESVGVPEVLFVGGFAVD